METQEKIRISPNICLILISGANCGEPKMTYREIKGQWNKNQHKGNNLEAPREDSNTCSSIKAA